MRIYMFRSQVKRDLRAFAGDLSGSRLPDKYGPWLVTGLIKPENEPPHRLPRKDIEAAIDDQGFQLWRMKPVAKVAVS